MIAVGNVAVYNTSTGIITVGSLLVIIHDIQLPHKLHIQAQLKISGFKWVDVQYIQY